MMPGVGGLFWLYNTKVLMWCSCEHEAKLSCCVWNECEPSERFGKQVFLCGSALLSSAAVFHTAQALATSTWIYLVYALSP